MLCCYRPHLQRRRMIPSPHSPGGRIRLKIRAAGHRGSPFQLQAGPGTGKTRTLVKSVLSLLAEGVHPTAILILTFSNRAAGELANVHRFAVAPSDAPRIWIGTFHAFGLDLVRRYHERLGIPAEPVNFWTRATRSRCCKNSCRRCR